LKQRGGGPTYNQQQRHQLETLASVIHLLFSHTHLSFSHPLAQIHWEELVGLPIISHFIPRIMDFVGLPATHRFRVAGGVCSPLQPRLFTWSYDAQKHQDKVNNLTIQILWVY